MDYKIIINRFDGCYATQITRSTRLYEDVFFCYPPPDTRSKRIFLLIDCLRDGILQQVGRQEGAIVFFELFSI